MVAGCVLCACDTHVKFSCVLVPLLVGISDVVEDELKDKCCCTFLYVCLHRHVLSHTNTTWSVFFHRKVLLHVIKYN